MDDIQDFVSYALEQGLPRGFEAVGQRIGNLTFDKVLEGNQWENVRKILYSSDLETGLLSELDVVVEKAFLTVAAAQVSCKDSTVAFKTLASLLEGLKPPLRPQDILSALQKAWTSFDAAAIALEAILETPKSSKSETVSSLATLEAHVSKASHKDFVTLRAWLSPLVEDVDVHAFERHVYENEFEQRRINGGLVNERTCTLVGGGKYQLSELREAWQQVKGGPYLFWWNIEPMRNLIAAWGVHMFHRPMEVWAARFPLDSYEKYNRRIQTLPSAEIKNGIVTLPDGFAIDRNESSKNQFLAVVTYYVSVVGLACEKEDKKLTKEYTAQNGLDFDKLFAAQQCIVKALSTPGHSWDNEDRFSSSKRVAAYFLREYLDTTICYMSDLSQLVEKFRTKVVDQAVTLIPSLRLDLQDLHASLYYGDTQDQCEAIVELQKSMEKWNSTLETLDSAAYKRFPEILPYTRFSQASFSNGGHKHSKIREGADGKNILAGLDVIHAPKDKNLSVKAVIDDAGQHKVALWNGCVLTTARARFLELPDTGNIDFGTVTTEGRQMHALEDPAKEIYHDFPVVFQKSTFSSAPTVITWISGLSFSDQPTIRVTVEAANVSTTGFTLRISTWGNTKLEWMGMAWFAHPTDSPYISSGRESYTKRGQHTNKTWAPFKRIEFPTGKFATRPRVFAAISKLDLSKNTDPSFRIMVGDLSEAGMRLTGETLHDTDNLASDASYIAFDDQFFL